MLRGQAGRARHRQTPRGDDAQGLLVILRAEERWAPDDALSDETAIIRRKGRVLVELAHGSTHVPDDDVQFLPSP